MEEMSLPALFEQARKIATDSVADKETFRKGFKALKKCEEMISKLGLFSSNETKEYITTTNLKYILVPFYLGELIEKTPYFDRLYMLKASQASLEDFLSFCDAMELVPQGELESTTLNTPVDAGDEGEEDREAWLTTISLAIRKALDLMEMLKKEDEILSAIKEKQELEGDDEERTRTVEYWHRNGAARARYTKAAAAPITRATFAQDVVEGKAKVSQAHDHKHQPLMFGPASLVGGTITSERERIAAQVSQPGHRLPTMSTEEANSSLHNDKWKPRAGGAEDDDEDDEVVQDKAKGL